MSEQVVAPAPTAQPANIQYVLYDPARRKRRRGRRAIGGKPVYRGPRGGVAWIGPSAMRYDPALVAYEPRRRRYRKYDPVRAGGKAVADSVVDGLGFGLVFHALPMVEGTVGPLTYRDIGAGLVTAVYEKAYMKRGWAATLIGAISAIAAGKLVQTLGGWKP